jgi:hypothetical protein
MTADIFAPFACGATLHVRDQESQGGSTADAAAGAAWRRTGLALPTIRTRAGFPNGHGNARRFSHRFSQMKGGK